LILHLYVLITIRLNTEQKKSDCYFECPPRTKAFNQKFCFHILPLRGAQLKKSYNLEVKENEVNFKKLKKKTKKQKAIYT